MVHGWTETIGGRSAERPTRSRTGNGRIVKEEEDSFLLVFALYIDGRLKASLGIGLKSLKKVGLLWVI